jgi:hypothetical protein
MQIPPFFSGLVAHWLKINFTNNTDELRYNQALFGLTGGISLMDAGGGIGRPLVRLLKDVPFQRETNCVKAMLQSNVSVYLRTEIGQGATHWTGEWGLWG